MYERLSRDDDNAGESNSIVHQKQMLEDYAMKHGFTTIPGVLWIVTAVVLFFYRLNKKRYNEIVEELKNGRKSF